MKKAERKLTINWDLDGVIYDFSTMVRAIADRTDVRIIMAEAGSPLPDGIPPISEGWNMEKAFGISRNAFWDLFYLAIERGVFRDGKAFPDSIETVDYCVRRGHRVRIVTSKQFGDPRKALVAQRDVLEWLHENTPWYHKVEVCFTGNKQGYEADVVIDDKPDLSWAQTKATNLLVARSWNVSFGDEGYELPVVNKFNVDPFVHRVEMAKIRSILEVLEAP
jgi:5'(3')-deoxyribonucleotidase